MWYMQALNQLNESVQCFKRCRELKADCETSRAMYQAALCELKMTEVSRERSDKLDRTQKKLDQFYENMDMMRQNQYIVSKEEEIGGKRWGEAWLVGLSYMHVHKHSREGILAGYDICCIGVCTS